MANQGINDFTVYSLFFYRPASLTLLIFHIKIQTHEMQIEYEILSTWSINHSLL